MSENKVYSEIEMIDPAKIKPNLYNPNIMTAEQLKSLVADFRENGWIGQPVVVNDKMEIIDGEHRWKAGKEAGFEKIPIVKFQPENEEHQKIVTIALNSKRGEMNPLKLAGLILELNKKFSLDELSVKLGFSASDLKDKLFLNQVTKDFIEKMQEESEKREQEALRVMNFALTAEQEKAINKALEISFGKCKGEKLAYICSAYLNDKPKNGKG